MTGVEEAYETAEGPNDYAVAIVAPASPGPGLSRTDFKSPHLRMLNLSKSSDTGILTIEIPAGSAPLVAALYDENFNVPQGVNITVTKPDGTVLNQPTSIDASDLVVQTQNGYLTGLVVTQPDPGTWTIQVDDDQSTGEYTFFFSTIPTQDPVDTFDETLGPLVDTTAISTSPAPRSARCHFCQLGVMATAALVAVALVAGTYALSPSASIVLGNGIAGYGGPGRNQVDFEMGRV